MRLQLGPQHPRRIHAAEKTGQGTGLSEFLGMLAAKTNRLRPKGRVDRGVGPRRKRGRLAAAPAPRAMTARSIHWVAKMGPQRRHLAAVLFDPAGNLPEPLDLTV